MRILLKKTSRSRSSSVSNYSEGVFKGSLEQYLSDQFSYLEDREFGKVTAQAFVDFEEDKRLDLYDRLLEQADSSLGL